jgi:hypothetical protein
MFAVVDEPTAISHGTKMHLIITSLLSCFVAASASYSDELINPHRLWLSAENGTAFYPNAAVKAYLENLFRQNSFDSIIEVGPGGPDRYFEHASAFVDQNPAFLSAMTGRTVHNVDIEQEKVPAEDNSYDFVYCRHVMEDLNDIVGGFKEVTRLAKFGYIETPSPMIELFKLGSPSSQLNFLEDVGFMHHRYLTWTDHRTNTLFAIPKYPRVNAVYRHVDSIVFEKTLQLITESHIYFNNYYMWNKSDSSRLPRIVLLKHERDFDLRDAISYFQRIIDASVLNLVNIIYC